MFRRIRTTPRPKDPPPGWQAIDTGAVLGGHNLGAARSTPPRTAASTPFSSRSSAATQATPTLAAYIEEGDPFEDNALNGVL